MRPLSRRYIEAKSSDPREAPAINPRHLSEQTDRRAIVGGLRFVRRLFAAPVLAQYCGAEILPGAHIESDDELLDYARRKGSTVYHATCTCKMGNDQMAVVDNRLYDRRYLAGDEYMIADMISCPWTVGWEAQGQDINEFKYFKRWFEEVGNRPAVKRGMEVGNNLRVDPSTLTAEERAEMRKIMHYQRAIAAPVQPAHSFICERG